MLLFASNIEDTWTQKLIYFNRIYPLSECNHVVIGWNSQQKLINWINMSNLYGNYSGMLDLAFNMSSLSFQLRGKSEPSLLYYVKGTYSNSSIPWHFFNNHIKKVNQIQKRKSKLYIFYSFVINSSTWCFIPWGDYKLFWWLLGC